MTKRPAILLLFLVAPPVCAEPAADPWAEVPALPTACYRGDDPFESRANAAAESMGARVAQQKEINQAIEQQYGQVDMSELQQRMMTFMMEHPDQAQRYLEAVQQGGQQVQELTPELAERSGQLETELRELTAAYDAELRQAWDPIAAQQQALDASLAQTCNEGLLAKAAALEAEKNRAYERLCAKWWPTGPLHDWLARYKQFKIEEAAHWVEYAETNKLNYEVMGVAADQYRSTADLEAPIEYLNRAGQVFFKREHSPVSEELGTCEHSHG
ncbi:MAG: hypothetical protein MUE63_03305 [Xanthomonadales bacterium]|jgi:hypothetical protein|nr:hypothetical protein [Xanthomonadales bacterium]